MPTSRLVLASASPARRKLLRAAGIEPDVLVSGIDESIVHADHADDLCLELARLKARAIADRISTYGTDEQAVGAGRGARQRAGGDNQALVLGCDSALAFQSEILGKPADAADAVRRWRRMRGRSGILHTGHCLIDPAGDRAVEAVAATRVHFATISDREIADYVATGEPLQVAGAFTIDGLGGPFVERIEGDPGTVIGLSLPLLRTMLGELGLRISDLWRPAPLQ